MMFRTILAVVMMMGFCVAAIADNYMGSGVGQVRLKDSAGGISWDANGAAIKLIGGQQFSENFALELAYIYGGSPEDKIAGVTIESAPRAMQASGIGIFPVTNNFGVYLRVSLLSWRNEISSTDGLSSISIKTDGEDFSWGLGASFDTGNGATVRIEYEAADFGGTDASFITLSGIIRFGEN